MKNECVMVMPPIYRFNLEGFPKESRWGWHKASDVVTTVNNILSLEQNRRPLTPEEMNEEFPFVSLNDKTTPSIFSPCMSRCSPVVYPDWHYGATSVGEMHWLATVVNTGGYIPAKIGMELIDAAKHPLKSAFKKSFN